MKALLALAIAAPLLFFLTANATTVIDGGGAVLDGHCQAANNIVVTQNDVTYQNYTLRNVTDSNVLINGYDHVTIQNMHIQNWNCTNLPDHNHAGIACFYCKHLTVRNSTLSAPPNNGNGVYVLSNDANPSGGGHSIINNTISGGWDGIGGDEEAATHGSFDVNTMISGNTVSNCWDDGIQVEGGDARVIVEYNDVSGCGDGIAFAAPVTGPLGVQYNFIHNLTRGPQGNLYCFKVGDPSTALTYLRNNECNVPLGGADGISSGAAGNDTGMGPITARRNNFETSRYTIEMYPDSPAGQSYDYDCLTTTDANHFVHWGSSDYGTIAAFSAATGQEAHGVTTCPTISLSAPPACPDYNGDGKVTITDLTNYSTPTYRYDAANYDPHWDRNGDGVITQADLQTNWPPQGTVC